LLVLCGCHGHADHLDESNDRAEDQTSQVEPRSVKPVIAEFAEDETENNGGRNNKTDFGVASCGSDEIPFFVRLRVGNGGDDCSAGCAY